MTAPVIIGIDTHAIQRIERVSKELQAASSAISLASFAAITGKLDAAVKKILDGLPGVSRFAGLDQEDARQVRQGIETIDGGLHAAQKAMATSAALGLRGPAAIAVVAGAALLGAAGGATRERARQFSARAALADSDAHYESDLRADALIKQAEEVRAARRRARSIR